jgi:Site-specific DNA methylase
MGMAKRVVDELPKALSIPHGRITLPFNRYGSKARWAKKLAALLPEHSIYVEVFGGTGAVLLSKQPSPVEVFNDIDGEVVNFFQVLRTQPAALIMRCFFNLTAVQIFNATSTNLYQTTPLNGLQDTCF